MYPHKFMMHYKCECYGKPQCNCPRKTASSTYFLENINDIANTLSDIMVICGIHQCKAKAAIDIVTYSFLHYDEIRHRVDAVPRKRLCKEDLIHDLGRKCLMNRMEAQLTYSIIKRAFKAFYHGTSEGGLKNRAIEAEAIHTSECLWVHAAKRTAQVFASYEGMFFSAQKSYEAQIRCAYKRLYDRLQSRKYPIETMAPCECKTCFQDQNEDSIKERKSQEVADPNKEIIVDPTVPPLNNSEYKARLDQTSDKHMLTPKVSQSPSKRCEMSLLTEQQLLPIECSKPICNLGVKPPSAHSQPLTVAEVDTIERIGSNASLNLPRCYKCNCPKLVCDCDVDLESGLVSTECSQGPFTCRWIRVDDEKDDDRPDPCMLRPEEHECPVDCEPTTSQLSCNVECECDCEDCECIVEDSSGYDDEDDENDQLFEMEEEAVIEEIESEKIHYEIPDISTLEPNKQFANCRVQHVVEESPNIAQIEIHQIEAILRAELLGSGEVLPEKKPINATEGPSKVSVKSGFTKTQGEGEGVLSNVVKPLPKADQSKREETEAISKILADLI